MFRCGSFRCTISSSRFITSNVAIGQTVFYEVVAENGSDHNWSRPSYGCKLMSRIIGFFIYRSYFRQSLIRSLQITTNYTSREDNEAHVVNAGLRSGLEKNPRDLLEAVECVRQVPQTSLTNTVHKISRTTL